MAEDEELLAGPRLPRWLVPVGGALVAALVLALVALNLGGADDPSAPAPSGRSTPVAPPPAGTSAPVADPAKQPAGRPAEPGLLGPDVLEIGRSVPGRATDVVTDGPAVWYAVGNLVVVRRANSVVVGGPGAGPGGLRLAPDPTRRLIWSYVPARSGTTVTALATRDLRVVGSLVWPRPIAAAVALDGWLYVSDPAGVWAVHPNGQEPIAPLLYGVGVRSLAADPTRHRLLVLVDDGGLRIVTLQVGPATDFFPAPGFRSGTLAVTRSGAIWLAGQGDGGAVLVRLNPRSLAVDAVGGVTEQLGPTDSVVAGDSSLLIGEQAGQTWCVGGSDGALLQRFPIAADHAGMTTGAAYATRAGRLYRLNLEGPCTG